MGAADSKVDAILAEMDREIATAADRARGEQHPIGLPFVVYRLFDYDWDLVYVGATSDFEARMSGHGGEQRWWIDIDLSVIATDHFATEAEAAAFEGMLIAERQPKHNRLGTGGRRCRSFDTAARAR